MIHQENNQLTAIADVIILVRDIPVILASDLADFYETETKRINEYRARNAERFEPDYAFQLTGDEWQILKSQNATSSSSHGGSRTPPWVYTEHGVAMMSMGMKSESAVRLSKVIIDTFIDYRRRTLSNTSVIVGPNALKHRRAIQEKLYRQIQQLLDVPLPTERGQTVRDELSSIGKKALARMNAVIERPSKENEKISAEVTKILAEAEKLYAETRKLNEEADGLAMRNLRERVQFIRELREMAQQLERDDWIETFDDAFGRDALPHTN